jgi:hypothetical protein
VATLTVLQAKARLGPRLGPYAGLADLDDALGYSLGHLGVLTADALAPADADLVAVAQADHAQLLDVARLRALETVLLNLTSDLLREAGVSEKVEDVRPTIERAIAVARRDVLDRYGVGLSTLTAGVISLDFAATDDPAPIVDVP